MRSNIASKIYNETPESIKNEVREMANALVFDATTYGPDEVPAQINDYDGEVGYSYSECVLVDTYGDREGLGYNIGWFDFDKKTWFFKENSHDPIGLKEAKKIGLRWSFLPLAIYDTNPELRKTVKL